MMSAHRSRKGIPSEAAYCVPVEAKPRLVHKNMAQLRQYQASVVYCIFVMYESSVMSVVSCIHFGYACFIVIVMSLIPVYIVVLYCMIIRS